MREQPQSDTPVPVDVPFRARPARPVGRRVPTRRTERPASEQFRLAILDTARTLYRKGGYAAVTMREIATRLGIKAPSLYHHFRSKDDIFAMLQERAFEIQLQAELRSRPNPDALEDLREFFWRYSEFGTTHPDYFAIAYVDPAAPPLQDRVYELYPLRRLDEIARSKIRRCIDEGVFPRDTEPYQAGQALWAAIHGPAALQVIHHRHVEDPERLAAQALELTLAGIRAGVLTRTHIEERAPQA